MDNIMSISITWDTLIDEFSVFIDHHVLRVQISIEFIRVFFYSIQKAFFLHFICNCEDFSTSHGLVTILSQEVDPSNYRVILIVSGNELFECRVFKIVCEFLNLAFFNEPKLSILGHSRIYNVLRSKDDLFHNVCQL